MVQGVLFILTGSVFAYVFSSGPLIYSDNIYPGNILSMLLWFLLGGFLSTAVRFVGPRREHIITFLGTVPIQTLKTGIRPTLPWPFGLTRNIVSTEVRAAPVKVQIKSQDELVFLLPVTIQFRVVQSRDYAINREAPRQQMENLVVAAIRSVGNSMTFQNIYDSKDHVKDEVDKITAEKLLSFGIEIVELVVEDPELPDSIARSLNSIRQAEYDRQAAVQQAKATYERMVGAARAEAESTRLKGAALSAFRMQIAEGNAAAIAVMQGKLAVTWTDKTIGEGADAKTIKVARYVDPASVKEEQGEIPEVNIDPRVILEFFKVVDTNDAIRDAAGKEGTVIIVPGGGSSIDFASIAALTRSLDNTSPRMAA